MPHQKYNLLRTLEDSIISAGWNFVYLESIDNHPFRLQIYNETEHYNLRIYIWHLTHGGGRARPENEYRIQITGVPNFVRQPDEKTIILGYWDSVDVFAGFDFRKHSGRLGFSPSIQIREEYLRKALIDGFSPCDKGNQEIAIAFRPDFFVDYVRYLEQLHNFGQYQEDLIVFENVIQDLQINDSEIPITNVERRSTVVLVRKSLRESSFKNKVLTAYRFSCATCGIQLKLIDAAHIIPVYFQGSTDETCNGIALCALHHRAYDQSLITVDEHYSVLINENRVDELRRITQIDGIDFFRSNLRPIILLPPAIADRPRIEYLSIANQIRGW